MDVTINSHKIRPLRRVLALDGGLVLSWTPCALIASGLVLASSWDGGFTLGEILIRNLLGVKLITQISCQTNTNKRDANTYSGGLWWHLY